MKINYPLFVALRYLKSKRKEIFISVITVISVISVAISVMVLNVVLSVMTGFETELQNKLISASSHITVSGKHKPLTEYQQIAEKIRTIPGVTAVFPFTENQAMMTVPIGSRGVIIRGVADEQIARKSLASTLANPKDLDRLFQFSQVDIVRQTGETETVSLPPVILGRSMASSMNLIDGDTVTVVSPEGSDVQRRVLPKMGRFAVIGNYKLALIEEAVVYVSLRDAQNFFGLGESVSGVEVNIEDLYQAPKIAEIIENQLSSNTAPIEVLDWTDKNRPLWESISLGKKVYFAVLCLLVLVASFSIVSTLVMVVMEKARDISILKTMGATNSGIRSIFLLQGSIIGVTGVVFGTALGWLVCVGLRDFGFEIDERGFSVGKVPVQMELVNFIAVAVAGLVITVCAGIYPARRAATLPPAEVLRFE